MPVVVTQPSIMGPIMSQITEALGQVAERLVSMAEGDADLRKRLRTLAQAVLIWTQESLPSTDTQMFDTDDVQAVVPSAQFDSGPTVVIEKTAEPTAEPPAPLPPIKFIERSMSPTPDYQPTAGEIEIPDAELPMIEARCRLKAEGTRWAVKRQQKMEQGADFKMEIEPFDRDIIERAKKLPDCFLWVNHSSGPTVFDSRVFEDMAGCFETVADAVGLVRGLLNDSSVQQDDLEDGLQLLAEAQSALRSATENVGYMADRDQGRVHQWLRSATWNRHIFIARFMKLDDPTYPDQWQELSERVQALDAKVDEVRQIAKQKQSAFKKARYHLNRIKGDRLGDHDHDWKVAIATINGMVQGGIPPSNTEIREMLLPVVDRLPDVELPAGMRLAMREVDRFLSSRPDPTAATSEVDCTPEVREAAKLLHGRTLVLIGGARRPPAEMALVNAFGLSGLNWIETREHESVATFEPHVARTDVAAVLLAIRWSSHSYGEVKQFCDTYGKPLVRLPAGYSPNQVAVQIIEQISEKLRASQGE